VRHDLRAWALLAAPLGALLVGCPLPQPLPDYPEGQPVTPPRVVVNDTFRTVPFPETVVRVPAGCPEAPLYALGATLRDANTVEPIVARWFVNYDLANRPTVTPQFAEDLLGAGDDSFDRETRSFEFPPYQYASVAGSGASGTAGALHVVELVVSNGFDPNFDTPTAELPYRQPKLGFEVQVYRWVFLTVTPSADVACPEPPAG
jgi:hypothetical protein